MLTFKGTVDVFGDEYDHQEDNDLDDDVEIDLHEKPNENEKVSNKKISLFRGTAKKNGVDTFYDEFHGSDVSDHSVVTAISFYPNVLAPFTHFFIDIFHIL